MPGDQRCIAGNAMVAAENKKPSGKYNTEMFGDVPVLERKWQAALCPGESLPRYEDVMLESLGRLADHIVLLRDDNGVARCVAPRPLHPAMAERRPLGYSVERVDA